MGLIRNTIIKLLDAIDPPKPKPPNLAPCPKCGVDVSDNYSKAGGGKDDLIYFLCLCGHASAWYWNGSGAQLIYGQEPGESYDDDL